MLPDLAINSLFLTSFQIQNKDYVEAIERMFRDESILSTLNLPQSIITDGLLKLSVQQLKCTVLNMNFFDKLVDSEIITETDYIRGCYEEETDGIVLVHDKLRLMCTKDNLKERGEIYDDIILPNDLNEFIFHLLKLEVQNVNMKTTCIP